MNDWLRDALRTAVADQPPAGDRAHAAFRLATRRRRERAVALSCATAASLVLATLAIGGGGSGTTGLQPVAPPSGSVTAPADPSVGPSAGATGTATVAPGTPNVTSPPRRPGSRPASPSPNATPVRPGVEPPVAPPSHRQPLDVFVLLDATVSMQSIADDLDRAIRGVHDRLVASGVDVHWGLASYYDTSLEDADPLAYRLVSQLGPEPVTKEGVRFTDGDSDPAESATIAMRAAVGVGTAPYAPDDEGAAFRPGARRVILLVTDAGIDESGQNPSIDEAVATMNEHDVAVVGVTARTFNAPEQAQQDLRRVAEGTGAVLGTVVDCDGDGLGDRRAGDPMVGDWYKSHWMGMQCAPQFLTGLLRR